MTNIDEKIEQLRTARDKIDEELEKLSSMRAVGEFKDITLEEVRKKWNKSDFSERMDMICEIPEFKHNVERLVGYGGLDKGEIETDIIENGWNDNTVDLDLDDIFGRYCSDGQ